MHSRLVNCVPDILVLVQNGIPLCHLSTFSSGLLFLSSLLAHCSRAALSSNIPINESQSKDCKIHMGEGRGGEVGTKYGGRAHIS